ncbi:hypothetical protein BH11VER1_BH11VER1_26320 [soil metagenome]
MAGLSDSCPKCGASITAPELPPDEPVITTPAILEQLVIPVEASLPKPATVLPPSELIQSAGPVITPRKKILQADATLPLVQASLTKPKDSELFPHVTPVVESLNSAVEPLLPPSALPTPEAAAETEEPISPLISLTVPEEVEPEVAAPPPGMGEVLDAQSSSSTLFQNQDTRPWLHGPFLSTAGPKKRLPRFLSSRYIIAIISFLLVDLFIFFIFRTQITDFFQEENRTTPVPQAPPVPVPVPMTPKPAEPGVSPVKAKVEDPGTPPKQDDPKPLAPMPMEKAVPEDTVQFTPVPVETNVPKAVAIPPVRLNSVPAEAQSAFDALRRFLEVPTWNERANYVKRPEVVKPLMGKNAAVSGDGPIVVSSINFIERFTKDKDAYCTFEVSGGFLPHPVLAIVEQPATGPAQVDWESFVEFKDDLLLKFLENNGAPNQKFRVTMQRIHYFDKDVPNLDSKDSFGIRQPNAAFEGHIFIEKNSALGKQLANQLPWGKDLLIIAELAWKTDSKSHWVELQEITSYGWRY